MWPDSYFGALKLRTSLDMAELKALNDKELDMIRERGLIPMV